MQPKITVIKAEGARYKLNFESDCGTITGRKVNVTLPAGEGQRSPHETRQAAVEN
jgi:hypothetical protein